MAAVSEPSDLAEHQVVEAAIIGARIIDPEIVNGRIVGGRIVGGRLVDPNHLGARTRRALRLDSQHRHTEVVAVIGLGLALLMIYML